MNNTEIRNCFPKLPTQSSFGNYLKLTKDNVYTAAVFNFPPFPLRIPFKTQLSMSLTIINIHRCIDET